MSKSLGEILSYQFDFLGTQLVLELVNAFLSIQNPLLALDDVVSLLTHTSQSIACFGRCSAQLVLQRLGGRLQGVFKSLELDAVGIESIALALERVVFIEQPKQRKGEKKFFFKIISPS